MDYPVIFKGELPEVLYHYTSQQGLISILTSHAMWATDIRFLNDASEYNYGERIIKNVISRRRKGRRGETKKFFEEFDASVDLFPETHFFVMSLTEVGDLLSQWRGYTPNGNGFSLGFGVEKLRTVLEQRGEFSLVKCIYEPDEQEKWVNQAIDDVLEEWNQRDEPTPKRRDNKVQIRIYPPTLLRILCTFLAPVFKNATFKEEKEWRFILTRNNTSVWKFRSGQSMITPFIEVNLLTDEDDLGSMPVSEVIIGPTPHPELARTSVRMLLESQSLDAWVRLSDIPFRSW
jgi:hypothetical protein